MVRPVTVVTAVTLPAAPVAAFWLSVIVLPLTARTYELAGMLVPVIGCPGTIPAVLPEVTVSVGLKAVVVTVKSAGAPEPTADAVATAAVLAAVAFALMVNCAAL